MNLATTECSCRQWQIRGKLCIHALHLMTVIGGEDGEVDQYCSEYFSVAKFWACIHALHLMTVIGGEDGEVDQYCSEYFSVAKFWASYAENVPALLGKDQWNIVDPLFKLHSPVLTRPPGKPRKTG